MAFGPDVVSLGGGPEMFAAVLGTSSPDAVWRLPILEADPAWVLLVDGVDPLLERLRESLLTLADGRLGTRGSVIAGIRAGTRRC